MTATSTPALRIEGIVKSFGGRRVLDGVSLSLAPGEVYALLGSNGAGKTTTLNLILGFLSPDDGSIEVAGRAVADDPIAARAAIAYLPESVMLHPVLTAVENLSYFALLAGRRLALSEAEQLLGEAGLPREANHRRAAGFSKGMRQKVGVAIALAKQAALLLLDEPTSGLDASAANDLSTTIRAASDRGLAVLMTTHDLFRVKDAADRLGILHHGQLVVERDAGSLSAIELEMLYLERLAA
jgi:ABC-2 type transport system ATP-binding protein